MDTRFRRTKLLEAPSSAGKTLCTPTGRRRECMQQSIGKRLQTFRQNVQTAWNSLLVKYVEDYVSTWGLITIFHPASLSVCARMRVSMFVYRPPVMTTAPSAGPAPRHGGWSHTHYVVLRARRSRTSPAWRELPLNNKTSTILPHSTLIQHTFNTRVQRAELNNTELKSL